MAACCMRHGLSLSTLQSFSSTMPQEATMHSQTLQDARFHTVGSGNLLAALICRAYRGIA